MKYPRCPYLGFPARARAHFRVWVDVAKCSTSTSVSAARDSGVPENGIAWNRRRGALRQRSARVLLSPTPLWRPTHRRGCARWRYSNRRPLYRVGGGVRFRSELPCWGFRARGMMRWGREPHITPIIGRRRTFGAKFSWGWRGCEAAMSVALSSHSSAEAAVSAICRDLATRRPFLSDIGRDIATLYASLRRGTGFNCVGGCAPFGWVGRSVTARLISAYILPTPSSEVGYT